LVERQYDEEKIDLMKIRVTKLKTVAGIRSTFGKSVKISVRESFESDAGEDKPKDKQQRDEHKGMG
jgi:hypothetical protein